ncbi:hypothetical protein HU200_017579 [Digitaria exilis]|uniref:Uncharacterized protein n=1 Tax=Digitaria exilis TaxID=1010633 RepID=A0A835F6D9_9POAL|nr:hypothetical protein HU200_017579 [Digitaria exilis]
MLDRLVLQARAQQPHKATPRTLSGRRICIWAGGASRPASDGDGASASGHRSSSPVLRRGRRPSGQPLHASTSTPTASSLVSLPTVAARARQGQQASRPASRQRPASSSPGSFLNA